MAFDHNNGADQISAHLFLQLFSAEQETEGWHLYLHVVSARMGCSNYTTVPLLCPAIYLIIYHQFKIPDHTMLGKNIPTTY